jgi:hypothetical protein
MTVSGVLTLLALRALWRMLAGDRTARRPGGAQAATG